MNGGNMNTLQEQIIELKKKHNVAILAHYYVEGEVKEIADYIGDSYYLSKLATTISEDVIIMCGVMFMGESVKILNPSKTVILPNTDADCPMAHMATVESVKEVRDKYDDVAVVCYINSTAELKAVSDVCVTSANALKVVKALPNKYIYFIPDQNLGAYVAEKVPEKEFIFNQGFCPVHHNIFPKDIEKARKEHPGALVLMHPECRPPIVAMADYVGSTSGIINYATDSDADSFIICTEKGVIYDLEKKNPDKKFYPLKDDFICCNMKKITLENVYDSLMSIENNVDVPDEQRESSLKPLARMLELAK